MSRSWCFHIQLTVCRYKKIVTLPELYVISLAPLAWLVYGQLSVLVGSAWHSVLLPCRLSEGRKTRGRFYMYGQRYWGRDDHFLFQNLRREVFCLYHGCVKSQASVGKGVHSAVSNNFRGKLGVKKHMSQL